MDDSVLSRVRIMDEATSYFASILEQFGHEYDSSVVRQIQPNDVTAAYTTAIFSIYNENIPITPEMLTKAKDVLRSGADTAEEYNTLCEALEKQKT